MKNILNSFSGLLKKSFVGIGAGVAALATTLFVASGAFAATDGQLTVLINGNEPGAYCIAGPITVSGSGVTGGQGSTWHLVIKWGDGSPDTTSDNDASLITSGSVNDKNSAFSYSTSHDFVSGSTSGLTVILYHVQESGQDGQVVVINQCVAAPTQGVVNVLKDVQGGDANPSDFTLHINGNDFAGSDTLGAGNSFVLDEGSYAITEDPASDYDQTGISCVGDDDSSTTDGTVTVVAGVNYTCTVTNTYAPAPTYSVTYNGNGNTGGTAPTDGNSYHQNDSVTVLGQGSLVKAGFSFIGWNTAANGSGTSYNPADTFAMGVAGVTLFAQWTALPTYTVTYDANGATSGTVPADPNNYLSTDTVTVLDNTGSLDKTAFSFNGWNTAADGSGTHYAAADTFTMGSGNVTLFAEWTALPTFAVTYDANGATSGTVPVDGNAYLSGATVIVLGNTGALDKTGYSFVGWNTQADGNGTDYAPAATFTLSGATTLFAKWSALPTYTVTYDANGATSGTVPADANSYLEGATVTVLGNTGLLDKTAYSFAGWATTDNATTPDYVGGDTFAMGGDDVTLYAVWTALPTYTVTYDANGATSGTVPSDPNNYLSTDTVTVLDNTGSLDKTAFSFNGWNTAADGSGTHYAAADTFTMGSGNVTLFAEWTALPACSDGIDNDGDQLVDSADPGCHSDGHADNPDSYNPNDGSEADRGSDVALTKTVSDSTPDANQNVTYTLTATNNGPDFAASVVVNDVLPAGATYVSDDGAGAYATSTGEWVVGSLANGASATLHITVKATASAGNSVTNTATALVSNEEDLGDPFTDDNTSSVTFTVNKPVHHGGGGGGGSGCPAGTHFDSTSLTCVPDGQVLGASTGQVLGVSCGLYMDQHLRRGGAKNNPDQVTKLQAFLNKHGFGTFTPTGFFGPLTEAAVKAFQAKYADQILTPWNLTSPTGLAYLTTIRELNLIECPDLTIAVPELVPWSQNPNAQ